MHEVNVYRMARQWYDENVGTQVHIEQVEGLKQLPACRILAVARGYSPYSPHDISRSEHAHGFSGLDIALRECKSATELVHIIMPTLDVKKAAPNNPHDPRMPYAVLRACQ